MRGDKPGQLVQMDHMSVSFPGTTIKSFTTVCPATAAWPRTPTAALPANATRFLEYAIDALPFAITALQVDGGLSVVA